MNKHPEEEKMESLTQIHGISGEFDEGDFF
jgi:hypothetical protein